jgi:hypothetical protein
MPQPYPRILICVKTSFLIVTMMSTSYLLVDDSLSKGCTNADYCILQDGA